MAKLRCGECGSTDVVLKNVIGRSFPYKNYPSIELKKSCDLNICSKCDNIIYYSEDFDLLDAALLESAGMKAKEYIDELKIMLKMNQKELARYLGLSEVYLSQIVTLKAPLEYKVFNLIESKYKLEKLYRKPTVQTTSQPGAWKSFFENSLNFDVENIPTGPDVEKNEFFPHVMLSSKLLNKYSVKTQRPSNEDEILESEIAA